MICLTCGTCKSREDGYCVNGHDDWFEWEDLFYHKLYIDLFNKLKETLNMSSSEAIVELYNRSDLKLDRKKIIKDIFGEDFLLGD